jgi:protein-S-isoprenylcysteine O-methyltransferase Ste14
MNKFRANVLITVIVSGVAAVVLWRYASTEWSPIQITGLAFFISGFILWTVARFQLGASITVTAQAKQLVSRGLYARIRNPIYVFGSTLIAGFILALGRPRGLLVLLVIVPFQVWRAHEEAKVLHASFGQQYELIVGRRGSEELFRRWHKNLQPSPRDYFGVSVQDI